MTIFAYARVFGREEGKSELGWSRRSGPCILDSRDSFLGGGKERGKLCDADATRASETTAGGRTQTRRGSPLARCDTMAGCGMPPQPRTLLLSSLPPLPFLSLSPLSPFPWLCHHVPRKSINTGTTRGPRCQGGGQKRSET